MKCPICSSDSNVVYTLTRENIKKALANHFDQILPANIDIIDEYKIEVCGNCKFSFATPQAEGSKSFYEWVTVQENYYPSTRWEYTQVKNFVQNKRGANLLDVGCGDGKFFEVLAKENKSEIQFKGLDLTEESIYKCQSKGYEAYCLDVKGFIEKFPNEKFDFIVSFHCLEHVSGPKEFIQDIVSLLKENGELFISTPYSPMTIEAEWLDILNNPPHHMGRWNKSSYEELGKELNLNVKFYMPESGSILSSTLESFLMSEYDTVFCKITNVYGKFLRSALLKPFKLFRHLVYQIRREKVNGKRSANVVLVKFSKSIS